MHWRASLQTAEKFEALRADPAATSRGLGLELFLAELFGREHFRVEKDLVADGRQIDLFVARGDLHLLVEAKWTKRRSQHDVVDEMRARLESAPPGVVGLVVSMSGFSPNVIERVERSAERPILLMDGDEINHVVARGGGLYSLVRSKMDQLLRQRKIVVGLTPRTSPLWLTELPEARLRIVDLYGRECSWWESTGDFSQRVSSLVSPDPNWARDGGIRLDLVMGARDANELMGLLTRLAQLGWISTEGTWRIEQAGVVWSGLGPAELARQLIDSDGRYRGRQFHHSEVAMYVDESNDGMVTLMADLSTTSERRVRSCELSFMLPGIPLDTTPYEALMAELPVLNVPSFQVLHGDPMRRKRLGVRGKPRRAKPLAYLVREGPRHPGARESVQWVEGIVAASPIPREWQGSRLGAELSSLQPEHGFVRLRQHHHLGDKVFHDLESITLVQTSYAGVIHLMGDWNYDVAPD